MNVEEVIEKERVRERLKVLQTNENGQQRKPTGSRFVCECQLGHDFLRNIHNFKFTMSRSYPGLQVERG